MSTRKLLIFIGTCISLIIGNMITNLIRYKAARKQNNKGVNK